MKPLTSAGAATGDADRSPERSADRQRSANGSLRMTAAERASGVWLSLLSGSRMLGLFLILPVFAVHAATMPGGSDPMRIGLALGIYGLTQALLQIPFGIASDRFGRKPVITVGLLVMAVGSWVAAQAQTVDGLTVGRALQGAGAVSAAITALLADNTRDSQRSKAMAMLGAMIGVSFALSLVLAPALYRHVGLSGLFDLSAAIALLGIVILWWRVPDPPSTAMTAAAPMATTAAGTAGKAIAGTHPPAAPVAAPRRSSIVDRLSGPDRGGARATVLDPDLLRLNAGIFILHLVQMALFVVVPGMLVAAADLPLPQHWMVYLPVVVLSFVVVVPLLIRAERLGTVRQLFLGGIVVGILALVGYAALSPTLVIQFGLLLLFFVGFNLLEALLPSLVSRLAPVPQRGLALGVYNTTLALGLFCGGAGAGLLSRIWGGGAVFLFAAALMAVWLLVAFGQKRWPAGD
jgi:MFS family permease